MTEDFDHSNHAKNIQQTQLVMLGVPWELAGTCADIIMRDDPSQKNLGRSSQEQELIKKAYQLIAEGEK